MEDSYLHVKGYAAYLLDCIVWYRKGKQQTKVSKKIYSEPIQQTFEE
jgi:hypothetical protein